MRSYNTSAQGTPLLYSCTYELRSFNCKKNLLGLHLEISRNSLPITSMSSYTLRLFWLFLIPPHSAASSYHNRLFSPDLFGPLLLGISGVIVYCELDSKSGAAGHSTRCSIQTLLDVERDVRGQLCAFSVIIVVTFSKGCGFWMFSMIRETTVTDMLSISSVFKWSASIL